METRTEAREVAKPSRPLSSPVFCLEQPLELLSKRPWGVGFETTFFVEQRLVWNLQAHQVSLTSLQQDSKAKPVQNLFIWRVKHMVKHVPRLMMMKAKAAQTIRRVMQLSCEEYVFFLTDRYNFFLLGEPY
jgi:hypothetical protein